MVPVAAACVYLVSLTFRFQELSNALYWNSDIAFFPVLAEGSRSLTEIGPVNVGNTPHFSTLWFLMATKGLPFHHVVWSLAPFVTSLATAGLIMWAAAKVGGRWAGILAGAICVSGSPIVLLTNITHGFRAYTWLANALLLAFLIFLLSAPAATTTRKLRNLAVIVVLIAGASLASDPLFLAAGLMPFLAAGLLVWFRYRDDSTRRVAFSCAAVVFGSIFTAFLVTLSMHRLGIQATLPVSRLGIDTFAQIPSNGANFFRNLLQLGNGYFFGISAPWLSAVIVIAAGMTVLGFILPLFLLGTKVKAQPRCKDHVLFGYVAFWASAELFIVVAFLAVSSGSSLAGGRYLVPVFYAIAAVAPVWAAKSVRSTVIVSLGAALFCSLSVAGQKGLTAFTQAPMVQQAPAIMAFLKSQGVSRGYAGYWNSHAMTWQSGRKINFYPVTECHGKDGSPKLCRFPLASRKDWYRPRVKERTFLLVDPSIPLPLQASPGADLGKPILHRRFGTISLYLYGFDLAAKISPGKT